MVQCFGGVTVLCITPQLRLLVGLITDELLYKFIGIRSQIVWQSRLGLCFHSFSLHRILTYLPHRVLSRLRTLKLIFFSFSFSPLKFVKTISFHYSRNREKRELNRKVQSSETARNVERYNENANEHLTVVFVFA